MRIMTLLGAVWLGASWVTAASASHLTVLQDLTEQTGGGPEYPPIIAKDGLLYGTTYTSNNGGGIYSISTTGKNFTVLYRFPGGLGGAGPFGGLVQGPDGLFYGTTLYDGTSGQGTVYQFDAATRTATIIHAFDFADGSTPYAGLVQDAAGNFYGTTSSGGLHNFGTIYKIAAGTHAFTKLADLSSASGGSVFAPLIVGADGLLYGAATGNGSSGDGTIFRLSPQGGKIEVLHTFSGQEGAGLYTGLTESKTGTLYGVTEFGGQSNLGVLFAFAIDRRKLTVLHSFTQADGAYPGGQLTFDYTGRLLGTTFSGGQNNSGTIYRYDPATSSFKVLYQLSAAIAGVPNAGLTYAGGKTFYGGTLDGGSGQFEAGAIIRFSE